MKEKISLSSGVTLIALAVTIVVLIILAGITVTSVFGDNGILIKARETANQTNATIEEGESELNDLYNELSNAMNSTTQSEPEEQNLTVPENWDTRVVNPILSHDNKYVPVPKGYTASSVTGENTVVNGFVIYEGEEAVTDENATTAREERNQFVWVPVSNVNDMYGTDVSGKKWGKLYSFSASEIVPLNWTEQDGQITITDETSYREPDVESVDSSNSVTETQIEIEFNNMIASVTKYGGFYIGRYETGNLSQTEVVVVKNNSDIGSQTWYTMYQKSKGIAANSNVTSTMIWGSQWDATLRWMYNSGDIAKKTYTYDSTGKGNYSGGVASTGANDSYAVNNIYDMAGNVFDWTMEAHDRVYRGGYYSSNSSNSLVSSRSESDPTSSGASYGSRLSLYININ